MLAVWREAGVNVAIAGIVSGAIEVSVEATDGESHRCGTAHSRQRLAAQRTATAKARKGKYWILNSRQRRPSGAEIGRNFDIAQCFRLDESCKTSLQPVAAQFLTATRTQ